jgi:heat shock protein 5
LIGGSSQIPKIRQLVTEYFGKEPVKGIDPEEAVTHGAAIQAGILTGYDGITSSTCYFGELSPLTLGVEASGGVTRKLIGRHAVYPTRKLGNFSTMADNQSSVLIRVLEGERTMAKDNELLGEFVLANIAPAPQGVPQIQVSIEIDASGSMNVTAMAGGT